MKLKIKDILLLAFILLAFSACKDKVNIASTSTPTQLTKTQTQEHIKSEEIKGKEDLNMDTEKAVIEKPFILMSIEQYENCTDETTENSSPFKKYEIETLSKVELGVDFAKHKDFNEFIRPNFSYAHLNFNFSKFYNYIDYPIVLCGCDDRNEISTNEVFEITEYQCENGVKLQSYNYIDNFLELLYEDGFFLRWNNDLYAVDKMCFVK